MLIFIHVTTALIYFWFAGYGILEFFSVKLNKSKKREIYLIMPVIGYMFSQIIFYYWYYFFEVAAFSLYMTVATIVIINYLAFYLRYNSSKIDYKKVFGVIKNPDKKLFLVLFLIFLVSSWQYILIGEGHYYHSGNNDFLDAVRGGELFLANTPIKYIHFDLSGYIKYHAIIKYQYSSQAFFRLLLDVGGVDGFMLQSILNLFLTSIGVYWLTLYVFRGTRIAALFAAFWSVTVSFYLVTYFTGHVGSMMFVSIAPTFLGLFLLWLTKEIHWWWVFLLGIFYYFLDNTYPGPIYYLAFPALVVALYFYLIKPFHLLEKAVIFFGIEKNTHNKISFGKVQKTRVLLATAFVLLVIILSFIWVWNWFEPRRVAAILRTNVSWKITLYKEMLMVFWGIYPPGSTGTTSLLPLFISDATINTIALISALLVSCLALYFVFKSCRTENRLFLIIYAPFFLIYLVVMRYFWGSPYYLYKFLYLYLFLIVIFLLIGLFENYKNWSRWIRMIFAVGFILLGTLNVVWDVTLGIDFYRRPYHEEDKIEDFFSKVPSDVLKDSYLNIPNEIDYFVFRRIFFDHGIYTKPSVEKSKYIVSVHKVSNAIYNSVSKSKVIYDNGLLSVTEIPKSNFLRIFTPYEPYNYSGVNLNWVGNELSVKKYVFDKSIIELLEYLTKNNMSGLTYLDIKDVDIYKLFYDNAQKLDIKLQPNPFKALWFIQAEYGSTFFEKTKNQTTVWKNELFSIEKIPYEGRSLGQYYPKAFDFSGLLNYIKSNGNSVYLDMPESEYMYQYLKDMLSLNGILVKSNHENTKLFLRFVLGPPYEKYNKYEVNSADEKEIDIPDYKSQLYRGEEWSIELFDIPFENRVILASVPSSPLPFRILTATNESDFSLEISNITEEAKYLRIFIEPGPSIDNNDFLLKISNKNGVEENYRVSATQTLINLPLSNFKESGNDSTLSLYFEGDDLNGKKLIGKSLMPLEERFLNYVIWGIELTDNINNYSTHLVDALNHKPFVSESIIDKIFGKKKIVDVINKNDINHLFVGSGWYAPEMMNEESFRWVGSKPAEIVLNNIDDSHNLVNVDLEPGPGCGGKPLDLKIFYKDQLLKEEVIPGRKKVEVKIHDEIYKSNNNGQIILKLVPETKNAKINSDPRILNFRVFNISLDKATAPQEKTIVDNTVLDKVVLGYGWYPYETYNGESFRWVGKDPAEIYLKDLSDTQNVIQFDLEPGPGCGGKPLDLKFYNKDKLLKEEIIPGRKNVEVKLPQEIYQNKGGQFILELKSETENAKISSDPRILNYRVFNVALKKSKSAGQTIIETSVVDNVGLGDGWYPYETYNGEAFQWVGKEPAEILLNNIDRKHSVLHLELETGPGCGSKPLDLKISARNKLIKKEIVQGRKTVEVPLPAELYENRNEQIVLKLTAKTENVKIPTDPRILNYRVFNVSLKSTNDFYKTIVDTSFMNYISLGNGWYPYETYLGKSFQWVGKEPAEIIFNKSDNISGKIKLKLEPGPSCGGEALKLNIYLNGKLIVEYKMLSGKTLEIDLKKNWNYIKEGKNIIKLVPITKNAVVPGDPRILNFRVFDIGFVQE